MSSGASGAIYSDTVKSIIDDFWVGNYADAIDKVNEYIENDPTGPVGYFLRGSIYQSISESYRNDRYSDMIFENLEKAIHICDTLIETNPENPEYYFIKGASYGYLGLHKAFHGSWWGAFKDGLKSSDNLEMAVKADSTYYDSYWGLGAYHYYKSTKLKALLWLPLVKDRRKQGIDEIRKAIAGGFLSKNLAREGLLRILLMEKDYDHLVLLADSVLVGRETEPYPLLYRIEGLIAQGQTADASAAIDTLTNSWKQSRYYDSLGVYEADLLRARILYQQGNDKEAVGILERLLDNDGARKMNAYYNETCDRAEEFYKKIR